MNTRVFKTVHILIALILLFSTLTAGCSSAPSQQQMHSQTQSQTLVKTPADTLVKTPAEGQTPNGLNAGTQLKPVPGTTAQDRTDADSTAGSRPQPRTDVISTTGSQSPEQIKSLLTAFKSITETFGEDPESGRNFTWITSAAVKTGVVQYCDKISFEGFDKPNVTEVTARSYITSTDADTRAVHKAQLGNLKPGTEYIYRVGDNAGGFSPQGVFKTAGPGPEQFTFINITDTQGGNPKDYGVWKNTLDKALGRFPDARFLVHTGDMVDVGQDISQWDMFTTAVQPEFLNLPVMPAVGNHEGINKNGTNKNFKNFTDRFSLPEAQDTGAPAGTVYSADYGNAHIAVMNTQCGAGSLQKQADWLRKDMKRSDRKWKIVALHRGPYGATYDTTDIRRVWTPAFDEAGVDLVLEGHDHNYMRSYPMKGNKAVQEGKGTVYIVSNTGGVKFYPAKKRSWQAVDLQPGIQMYIAVTVSDNKMVIDAYDINNTLRDSVTLSK